MNTRIKYLRKTIGLSQREFGKKIGVGDTAISKIEKGENAPSEQTLKSICREYNVNYFWLVDGVGDMFSDLPETLIDEIADEYDLDNLDVLIVKRYMQLSPDKRKIIKEYLESVFIDDKDE